MSWSVGSLLRDRGVGDEVRGHKSPVAFDESDRGRNLRRIRPPAIGIAEGRVVITRDGYYAK
jgi:hypothetical protein